MLESEVERLYQLFLKRVADARGSVPSEINAYAKGRVWAGAAALQRNLVDEIGGVESAVAYLQAKLKLPRAKVEFYPRIKHSLLEKQLLKNRSSDSAALPAVLQSLQPNNLRTAEQLLGLARSYSSRPFSPLAVMPELWFQL